MARPIEEIAKEAVEKLGLEKAIQQYYETLDLRLEEAEDRAKGTPVNQDMMFAALSLPIANGLIHFASTRSRLREAEDWISGVLRDMEVVDAEPEAMLAALTLIYLVNDGHSRNRTKKAAVWNSMLKRVTRMQTNIGGQP
jgi:hypothetical protein